MAYNSTGELRQAPAAWPAPHATAPGDGPSPYRYDGYGGAPDGAAGPFLREFFRTFFRHIRLFVLFVILGVAIAGVAALRQEETFSAHAVVLLEPPSEQFVEVVSPLGGGSLDHLMLQTQIQVVRSYDNLGAVVDELDLTNDPRFMGVPDEAPGTGGNAGAAGESLLDRAAAWLKGWVERIETLWAGDRAAVAGAPVAAGDASPSRRDRAIAKLADQLDIEQGGQSRTIKIGFTSEHRALAAAVPNTLANVYAERLRERASTRTSEASEWLNDRVEEVRAELEGYEQEIAALRSETGVVGPSQSITEREDYSLLTQRLIAAQSELADAQARLQSARDLRASGAGLQGIADVLASPIIAELKEQEAELRRQQATLAAELGPRHPQIVQNRTELAEIEQKLSEEAERIVNSLQVTVTSLENQVAAFERRLAEIQGTAEEKREVGIKLAELERKAEATRDLYYDLKRRSAEAYGGLGLVRAGATILSPAQPPTSPSSPPPALFLLAGLAVGIASGFAAIFVREQLDGTVRRSEDLQRLLGCPCIATVPRLSQRERLNLADAGGYRHFWRQTRFLESVRVIASYVHLAVRDSGRARGARPAERIGRTLLFTSAVPSEGKTTLSAASALAIARLGMRVVLVDTDLRCPRIAEHLQLEGRTGLLEVLTDGPTRYREFTQEVASGQVHVLPCSNPVPSPNEVLASAQFDELVSILRRDYDLVIFDAPPLLGLAEMSHLLRQADDILFVTRWGFAPRDTLLQAKGLVETHGRSLSACILSQIPAKRYRYYGEGDYGPMAKEYRKYFRE